MEEAHSIIQITAVQGAGAVAADWTCVVYAEKGIAFPQNPAVLMEGLVLQK